MDITIVNDFLNHMQSPTPFRIYDTQTGHFIFSILSKDDAGDIPWDVATLPIKSVRTEKGVFYIYV